MSLRGRGLAWVDRAFGTSLLILLLFGALRCMRATPMDFASSEGTLGSAYLAFVSPGIATYLYVPLFSFCCAGALRPLDGAGWIARMGSRGQILLECARGILFRSVLFAFCVVAPSLLALVLRSGLAIETPWVQIFALVQLAYETIFFMVVGFLFLLVRLLTRSGAVAMVACVCYGAIDSLVEAFDRAHDGSLWFGWMAMGWGDPVNPLLAVVGALRLASLVLVLLLTLLRVVRGADFLESREVLHD